MSEHDSFGAANHDQHLLGSWGIPGQVLFTFMTSGEGSSVNGAFRWATQGPMLQVSNALGTDLVPYQVQGDQLMLLWQGQPLTLWRQANAAAHPVTPSASAPTQSTQPSMQQPSTGGVDTQEPLAQLLLSSAWASFSFKGTGGAGGTTRQERFVFHPDGTWELHSSGETYSTLSDFPQLNYGGQVYSGRQSGFRGNWKVERGVLWMSQPPNNPQMVAVPLKVNRNSNGYPILVVNGVEYMQVR
jgi:hypothetical protein